MGLALTTTLAVSGPAEAARAARTGEIVGFSLGGPSMGYSDAELSRDLDVVRATGARWVRIDFDWGLDRARGRPLRVGQHRPGGQADPGPGLKILAILTYSPPWARPGYEEFSCAPADNADYANFVGVAVKRFAPRGITHWELWNEPNSELFWRPAPDPEAYADLIRQAYGAAKRASRSAVVVAGAMAPAPDAPGWVAPTTFLHRLYAGGAKGPPTPCRSIPTVTR